MPEPCRDGGRLLLLVLLAGLLLVGGCGRKAPPKPPQTAPLPVVTNLRAESDGDRVQLSWTLAPLEGRLARESQFAIYRDALPMSAGDCPTCPPRYQRVAQVSYNPDADRTDGTLSFQYTEAVARGYRYRYQVALRLIDGRQGEPSETVEVIFE
jgi:hypothetical protein